MKKLFLWIPAFSGMTLLILSLLITPVFAHVLKTDGNVGAVVHIDPEDDPIVGQETTIYFDIKDKSGKFNAENCDCIFIVKKAGNNIFSQPLKGTIGSYNFPEKNIYTLELKGTPKAEGQFDAFTLSYDVRVEREGDAESVTTSDIPSESNPFINFLVEHVPHIIIIGIVLLFCGYAIYSDRKKRR